MERFVLFVSPQQGRHGPRSAWGGQIGGAGVDRHAGAGVSMEQQVVKRSSFSSLSSSESDSSYNKHLHLRYSTTTTQSVTFVGLQYIRKVVAINCIQNFVAMAFNKLYIANLMYHTKAPTLVAGQ